MFWNEMESRVEVSERLPLAVGANARHRQTPPQRTAPAKHAAEVAKLKEQSAPTPSNAKQSTAELR